MFAGLREAWKNTFHELSHCDFHVIDENGYRANVGIIVANDKRQVLWARRIGQNAWQFPQGGIDAGEEVEDALFRELYEELGLTRGCVDILGSTRRWLKYDLPRRFVRQNYQPICIGQKQMWFLLRLTAPENSVRLDAHAKPEFDHWKWVNYWRPQREVIFFKRRVYRQALSELAPLLGFRHGNASRRRRGRSRHSPSPTPSTG